MTDAAASISQILESAGLRPVLPIVDVNQSENGTTSHNAAEIPGNPGSSRQGRDAEPVVPQAFPAIPAIPAEKMQIQKAEPAERTIMEFRLADNPDTWLTVLGGLGDTEEDVRHALTLRYADRLIEARPWGRQPRESE